MKGMPERKTLPDLPTEATIICAILPDIGVLFQA